MWKLLGRYGALMNAEGGSGGGGGQGGSQGGGLGGGGGGGSAAFQYPQGYPDALKGGTIEESFGKLFADHGAVSTRMSGLRDEMARRPSAPASADLYTFDPGDKLKPFFGDLKDNPIFAAARTAAHKHGMSQDAFAGFINDTYGPLAEQGLLSAPFDPANEIKSFMTATGMDAKGASEALGQTDTFAKGLMAQLKDVPEALKEDVQAQLMSLTDSAAGNVLLRALSGRLAENGIRIGGDGTQAGQLTREDLQKLAGDPRIDPNNANNPDPNKRFDPVLRKRFDDGYAKQGARPIGSGW